MDAIAKSESMTLTQSDLERMYRGNDNLLDMDISGFNKEEQTQIAEFYCGIHLNNHEYKKAVELYKTFKESSSKLKDSLLSQIRDVVSADQQNKRETLIELGELAEEYLKIETPSNLEQLLRSKSWPELDEQFRHVASKTVTKKYFKEGLIDKIVDVYKYFPHKTQMALLRNLGLYEYLDFDSLVIENHNCEIKSIIRLDYLNEKELKEIGKSYWLRSAGGPKNMGMPCPDSIKRIGTYQVKLELCRSNGIEDRFVLKINQEKTVSNEEKTGSARVYDAEIVIEDNKQFIVSKVFLFPEENRQFYFKVLELSKDKMDSLIKEGLNKKYKKYFKKASKKIRKLTRVEVLSHRRGL